MVLNWFVARKFDHCATMFSPDFALVATYIMNGIVRDKKVWSYLFSFSIEWDIDWVPEIRWIDGWISSCPCGVGCESSSH